MKYILKEKIEIIPLNEEGEGMVIFDCGSGDIFTLDEVASDILSCFRNESDEDKVVSMLCSMYEDDRSVIEISVKSFIDELVTNGLLIQASNN